MIVFAGMNSMVRIPSIWSVAGTGGVADALVGYPSSNGRHSPVRNDVTWIVEGSFASDRRSSSGGFPKPAPLMRSGPPRRSSPGAAERRHALRGPRREVVGRSRDGLRGGALRRDLSAALNLTVEMPMYKSDELR